LRTQPFRGSHLPVLMKLMSMTHGSVLELGCGIYSTIYLHWACYPTCRRLVTYENNPKYFDFLKQFENRYHKTYCIEDYGSADISEPWSIAFVDHAPDRQRVNEIKRLTQAEYVVAHDAENANNKKYKYPSIYSFFKYRWKFDERLPYTSIFSNHHDLSDFSIR